MSKRTAAGFTLVELLVVIGIIALLISILLPSLNKAREAGNRVVCGSNLHQVHIMIVMYANANRGQVPIGISGGDGAAAAWGSNYFLSRKTPGGGLPDPDSKVVRYMGLGLLYKAGLIKEVHTGTQVSGHTSGKVFYCPSTKDPYHSFNNEGFNEWPPSQNTCRSSYSVRPSINPDPTTDTPAVKPHIVSWSTAGASFGPMTCAWPSCVMSLPGEQFRLSKLKNLAIVSDICSIDTASAAGSNGAAPDRILVVHKNGLSVLYANGAVKFLRRDIVDAQVKEAMKGSRHAFVANSSAARLHDQMWNNFDAEMQLYPTTP